MADGRDFKTANVFMAEGSLLKIGDFGVSKVLSSTLALAKTAIGTPYYISPEICLNRPYNAKVGCASPAGLGRNVTAYTVREMSLYTAHVSG